MRLRPPSGNAGVMKIPWRTPGSAIVSLCRAVLVWRTTTSGTLALLDILMVLLIVLAVLAPAGYAALCRHL